MKYFKQDFDMNKGFNFFFNPINRRTLPLLKGKLKSSMKKRHIGNITNHMVTSRTDTINRICQNNHY